MGRQNNRSKDLRLFSDLNQWKATAEVEYFHIHGHVDWAGTTPY